MQSSRSRAALLLEMRLVTLASLSRECAWLLQTSSHVIHKHNSRVASPHSRCAHRSACPSRTAAACSALTWQWAPAKLPSRPPYLTPCLNVRRRQPEALQQPGCSPILARPKSDEDCKAFVSALAIHFRKNVPMMWILLVKNLGVALTDVDHKSASSFGVLCRFSQCGGAGALCATTTGGRCDDAAWLTCAAPYSCIRQSSWFWQVGASSL